MPRLWIVVFILFIACSAFASDITGRVVGIADGDTFTLLLKDNSTVRIRLHGIDTPEKGQPFGNNAKQFTSNLIFNKQVKVKQTDTDRYGLIVSNITNPEKQPFRHNQKSDFCQLRTKQTGINTINEERQD